MKVVTEDISPYKTGKRWEIVKDAIDYPLKLKFNVGNCTYYNIIFCRFILEGVLFVGIERIGCFSFSDRGFKHPNYVAEKLNLSYGDACNIADWLNAQLNIEAEEFGSYNDEECIDRTEETIDEDEPCDEIYDEETEEIKAILKDIFK